MKDCKVYNEFELREKLGRQCSPMRDKYHVVCLIPSGNGERYAHVATCFSKKEAKEYINEKSN